VCVGILLFWFVVVLGEKKKTKWETGFSFYFPAFFVSFMKPFKSAAEEEEEKEK